MKYISLIILSVFITFFANAQKKYTIYKGEHRSQGGFGFVRNNTFSFKVKFDSTAIYQTQNKDNQGDTNKLYGFADCFSSHHDNSARFGWRWFNNQLELMAYTYADGERKYEALIPIELNKEYTCEIKAEGNKYIFKVENKTVEMPRGCSRGVVGYKLFPYFGGDEVAPHDIHIWIRD